MRVPDSCFVSDICDCAPLIGGHHHGAQSQSRTFVHPCRFAKAILTGCSPYFGAGRIGVEISREDAVRVSVRELAERVRPGHIINDGGFTAEERARMHRA